MRPLDIGTDGVVVSSIGKRFGPRWVLRDLSFALAPGMLLGLVGANGGGKTTTLRLLAGLLRPDEGKGWIFGHDIARPSNELRGQIGYMSQRLSLYPELSVARNLAFRATVLRLPDRRAAVARVVDRYGLGPVVATRFDRLSGGWARKAQLAGATIHEPDLLLLDEPTSGLDAGSRHDFWRWLTEFASDGHIVIVSTHDLAEAERCPAILHYAEGRPLGPMSPTALIAVSGRATLEEAVLRLAAGAD